jgi:hypothetical protein
VPHAPDLVAEIANELFDRRYREARGEEYPDTTEDPA